MLYARLGHSDMPDMPLTARLDSAPDRNDLSGAVARIEQHLREHPEDGRGFEVIAPYLLRTGRGEDAVHAYSEALRLLGATAARHAALGEARVVVAQGVVTPLARKDFEAALALDAAAPEAQYYLGVAAAQAGEKDKAIAIFAKMAADAPADAAYLKAVNGPARHSARRSKRAGRCARAVERAGQSDCGDARRSASGDDPRHGRSSCLAARDQGRRRRRMAKAHSRYSVLAETEKAKKAVTDARKALASKQGDMARIEALAKELNIGG